MTIPSVQVAAGIIWRGNTFLVAERPKGGPRGGYWEFPGGKREAGETLEQTLRRELEEELGIECGKIKVFETMEHFYADLFVELHFMHVLSFTNEPVPLLGQELRWVTQEEAKQLYFLPADVQILDRVVRP